MNSCKWEGVGRNQGKKITGPRVKGENDEPEGPRNAYFNR